MGYVDIGNCQKLQKNKLYLVSKGYGELFSTVWNALSEYLEKDKWGGNGFRNLKRLMLTCFKSSSCCKLNAELGTTGGISLLFAALSKLEAYLDEEKDYETIKNFLLWILVTLHYSIVQCHKNLKIYREAQAFAILKKYLRMQDSTGKFSVMILAYVVDEPEREILSTCDEGADAIVQLLQELQEAVDCPFCCGFFTARDLLDGLNHLAISDINKQLIEKYNGIPTILLMLGDDSDEREQCLAAEAVWNLAFVESIRISTQLQEAVPCKCFFFNLDRSLKKNMPSLNNLWAVKIYTNCRPCIYSLMMARVGCSNITLIGTDCGVFVIHCKCPTNKMHKSDKLNFGPDWEWNYKIIGTCCSHCSIKEIGYLGI